MDPADTRAEIEDSLTHIIPREPFPQFVDDAIFLDVKELLSQHPENLIRTWSENSRLYTLLRMLGYDDDTPVFQKFDSEKISDFWLPLGFNTLDHLSSSVDITPANFRRTQLHVLSRSELMSEEKLFSPVQSHRHIQHGTSHFEELEQIGKGGSAEVTRVQHKLSGQQFACKRILRADTVKVQRNQLIEFEQEVGVLQRISHPHLVSFVASFTDLTSFSLILNPVAKDVLKSMLERQSREQPLSDTDVSTLRRAFGCLATALAYLHEQKVRHKDIKPGNILLSEGRVYLCDFGISRDWSQSENSTTEGDVLKFTRRYCAPEVFGRDPRNTKSDVWSLGTVFLELLSVVKGYPLEEMNSFLLEHSGDASAQGLWCAPDTMAAWLVELRSEKHDSADDMPLDWITPMIRTEPEHRLTVAQLVEMIHKNSADLPHPDLFLASCCAQTSVNSPVSVDTIDSPAEDESNSKRIVRTNTTTSQMHKVASHHHPDSRQDRGSQDGSISSHTQRPDPRESEDNFPISEDDINEQMEKMSVDFSNDKPRLHHIATQSDSQKSSSSFSPLLPGSEATSTPERPRSPVPPPTIFDLKCTCASLPNEKHIFNMLYASTASVSDSGVPFEFDSDGPTIDTCAKCEIGENKVQVYESPPQDPNHHIAMPRLWWTTRRLVVSYLSGNPEMRHCSSFWLPLADIQFMLCESSVTLRWSDCNHMTERSSGNYGTHWNWIYSPKTPNNSLTLRFNDVIDAQQFIDILRLPYDDGIAVRRGRRVDVSDRSELNVFDVGRPSVRNYRVAALTTMAEGLGTSKLFIHWPEVDLDIRILDSKAGFDVSTTAYQMAVGIGNVATPTYHSDTRGEPAADYERIARFRTALKLKTSMLVTFPIGVKHGLPKPPPAVTDMLRYLTGWTLRYFAIVTKIKSKLTRFRSEKYGRCDVMLWEKHNNGVEAQDRDFRVTFRLHEEAELLWISGGITQFTEILYTSGFDATVKVASKSRGGLVDVRTMTAIESETMQATPQRHVRSATDAHDDYSDLVLTFENARYRLGFVSLIEEFKAAAATSNANPDDSIHRMESLVFNDDPPLR